MTEANLLIVDDDRQICNLLRDFFNYRGYQGFIAYDTPTAINIMEQQKIDLLILDIMLCGADGLDLCRKIRVKSNLPIIILSALSDDTDRIVGLEVGADDYLTKPFNPHELLARVKALLRRAQFSKERVPPTYISRVRFGDWILDQVQHCLITLSGLKIPLSSGEYKLLLAFIEHAGKVLNRDQLLDLTRSKEYAPFDRSIDVQVGRLRKKLDDNLGEPKIILTVRSSGYCFVPRVEPV